MSEQKDIIDPSMGIDNQKNLPNFWFLYFIVILIFFGAAITAAMGEVGAM